MDEEKERGSESWQLVTTREGEDEEDEAIRKLVLSGMAKKNRKAMKKGGMMYA